jgi:hypothetical protein
MLTDTLIASLFISVSFYVSERLRRQPGHAAPPHAELAPMAGGSDNERSTDGRDR